MRREHQPLPGPRRDGEHLASREHDRRLAPLDPNPGSAFNATTPDDDPVNHGPIIALVGQGASPSNAASFRGFVALDIRNFQYQTPPSNVFYNGVTAGTNANTLKAMEAGWVATGYPGPDFPVVVPRLIPTTRSGSSTATRRASSWTPSTRYDPGAEILAAVYSGTVSSIPDFSYAVPSTATINEPELNRSNTITMSVTKNASFTGSCRRARSRIGATDPPVGHDADAYDVQRVR